MALVSDLVQTALRLIGVSTYPGRTPSPEALQEGFAVLNSMLDEWNTQRLLIYSILRQAFALTGGTASYAMGTGAAFNVGRPPRIEAAAMLTADSPPQEQPLEILTYDQWSERVQFKGSAGSILKYAWIDYGYPNVTINLWPTPASSSLQVVLYFWSQLVQFGTTGDSVLFPPGYQQALEYNLAVRLAPRWRTQLPQEVLQLASESLNHIGQLNMQNVPPAQMPQPPQSLMAAPQPVAPETSPAAPARDGAPV